MMKIFIQDSKGKELAIDGLSDETLVKELKAMIIKKRNVTNIPIELASDGQVLVDDSPLSEYNIEDGQHIIYYGRFIAGLKNATK